MALQLGTLVGFLDLDDTKFNQGLDGATKKGSGFGKLFAGAVAAGAVAAGAAIAGFSAYGLKQFIDLEQGMNEVFTLMPGITDDAMGAMTDDVRAFSVEMGIAHSEAVPALYQAISAGVPRENVFDFMEVAAMAAIGGVTDLETAVDGITSTVNAYGEEAVTASQASDLMFTAVRLGKTNFEELSSSLFQVNPIASALGVEFGDVTAALAAMTAQGVPTSVATTQLRQAFVEMSKEGTKTSDLFRELSGKTFSEFISSGGNTQEALQLLEEHAKDTGIGINDLFGSVEAGSAALALTGGGTDAFSDALTAMGDSAGATQAAYEQMEGGLGRSWERIKIAFTDAAIGVGETLAPAFKVLADWVMANMPVMQAVVERVLGALGTAASKLAGFFDFPADHPVIGVLASIREGIDGVVQVLSGGGTGQLAAFFDVPQDNPAIQALVRIRDFVTNDIPTGLNLARDAIQGVFNIFTGQGTGLLAKTLGVEQDSPVIAVVQEIKTAVEGLFTSLGGAVAAAMPFLGQVLTTFVTLGGAIAAGIGVALPSVITAFSGLMTAVGPLLGAIGQLIAFIQPVLVPVLYFLAGVLMGAVRGAIEGVTRIFSGLTNIITGGIALVKAVIAGDWAAAWDSVVQIGQGALQLVIGVIQTALNVTIVGIFRRGILMLLAPWRAGWAGVQSVASTVMGALRSLVSAGMSAVRSLVSSGINLVRSVFSAGMNAVRSVASSVWGAIRAVFSSAIAFVRSIVTAGVNGVRSVFTSGMALVRTVVTSGMTVVRSVFAAAMAFLRSSVSSAMSTLRSLFSSGMTQVNTAVRTGITNVMSKVREIPGKIKSGLGNLGALLFGAGQDVIRGLMDGIKAMAGRAVETAKNVARGAVQGVKGFLGIASPSRVFMEIGHDTGAGLVKGLGQMESPVAKAAAHMVTIPDVPVAGLPTFHRGDGSTWDRATSGPAPGVAGPDLEQLIAVMSREVVAAVASREFRTRIGADEFNGAVSRFNHEVERGERRP